MRLYRAVCGECGREVHVRQDGHLRIHRDQQGRCCPGSDRLPLSIRCQACDGTGRVPVQVVTR